MKPPTFLSNGTSLNCWSRCCFNMRLNFDFDLIFRTSPGSLFHFWMLLFCTDRMLDLKRISCSVLLFFLTKTLPLRQKLLGMELFQRSRKLYLRYFEINTNIAQKFSCPFISQLNPLRFQPIYE